MQILEDIHNSHFETAVEKTLVFVIIVVMNKASVLHLVLKHHWFDKIVSGEKTSEYRECSDYWNKRLTNNHYDTVVFHKGYTNITAVYKIVSISITTTPNDLNLPRCWEIKLKNSFFD